MMFGFIFRTFMFVSVVATYTMSVWNLISSHFIEEFRKYMSNQKIEIKNVTIAQKVIFNKTMYLKQPACTKATYFAEILDCYSHLHECKH